MPPRAQQRIEKQTSIKHITDHQGEAEVIEIDPAERDMTLLQRRNFKRIERIEARIQEIAAEVEVLGPKANEDIKLLPHWLESKRKVEGFIEILGDSM